MPIRGAVYVNGTIVPAEDAVIPVYDHGFLYGEGIYETLRTYDGVPFLYDRHVQRLRASAGHLALDIAAPYGSQIVAAQGGTVSWAGWRNNGGGYVISINHGNGMTTVYNHLGSIWVSPGQYVSGGQGIGGVGCTGMCTGPHVHFEVIVNGVIDNPLRYL